MIRRGKPTPEAMEERARAVYSAATRAAVIAGVFFLIVLGLMISNHFALERVDPQKSVELKQMKEQLVKHPRDKALKQKIRKIDLTLRREYLRRIEFANEGAYLLLVGVGMLLIAVPVATQYRKKLPMPTPHEEGAEEIRRIGALSRRAVAGFGAVAACGLVVLAITSRGNYESAFVKAMKSPESGVAVVVNQAAAPAAMMAINRPGAAPGSTSPVASPAIPAPPPGSLPNLPAPGQVQPVNPLAPGATVAAVAPSQPKQQKQILRSAQNDMRTVPFDPNDYAPSPSDWAANWPVFRGPSGAGFVAQGDYPVKWTGETGEGILWKSPIALPGWNSPVVWGDRVFVSGADKKSREVYCFDTANGRLVWKQSVGIKGKQADVSGDTGYAASTMATDGKRLFAIFPNGDLLCFDYTGKRLWARALGVPENMYGYATSLAMYRSLLLVLYDQGSGDDGKSALYGLQGATGNTVWRVKRNVANSWTSPIVINTGEREELITVANPWTISYNPLTGAEYWRADLLSGDVAPSPIYAGGFVLACNSGAVLGAIRPGGQGDVTKTGVIWKASDGLPDITSPASNGELIFLAASDGTVTCVECKTGKKLWDHAYETGFNASPTVVGDRVYMTDTDGVTHVIAANRAFKESHKCVLGEKVGATPAFVGGKIYIRGAKHLYCVGAK